MISVAVIEDNDEVRAALADAVESAVDMRLVGMAADHAAGRALLDAHPDVALIDLKLPDGDGIELIRLATQGEPASEVMVVTIFADERHVLAAIEAGAVGYILKDLPAAAIVEQIRVLRAGGSPISPIIARKLLTRFAASTVSPDMPADDAGALLSEQEQRVLRLAAKGFNYDEIAGTMRLSPHTVQTYVKRIYRKLQVNSKVGALAAARRLRLLRD